MLDVGCLDELPGKRTSHLSVIMVELSIGFGENEGS
jgi:hypothetical protein